MQSFKFPSFVIVVCAISAMSEQFVSRHVGTLMGRATITYPPPFPLFTNNTVLPLDTQCKQIDYITQLGNDTNPEALAQKAAELGLTPTVLEEVIVNATAALQSLERNVTKTALCDKANLISKSCESQGSPVEFQGVPGVCSRYFSNVALGMSSTDAALKAANVSTGEEPVISASASSRIGSATGTATSSRTQETGAASTSSSAASNSSGEASNSGRPAQATSSGNTYTMQSLLLCVVFGTAAAMFL